MEVAEYQKKAMRTARNVLTATKNSLLIEGVMGLNGEAGEAIDLVKKYLFQGHELDEEHLIRELGDILWYITATARALGYTLDDVMKANIEKLEARYGIEFDAEKSRNRKPGDI